MRWAEEAEGNICFVFREWCQHYSQLIKLCIALDSLESKAIKSETQEAKVKAETITKKTGCFSVTFMNISFIRMRYDYLSTVDTYTINKDNKILDKTINSESIFLSFIFVFCLGACVCVCV